MGLEDGHMDHFLVAFGASRILVAWMHWSMLEFPNIVVQISNTATQQSMDNTVVQTEAHTLSAHTRAAISARLRIWTDPCRPCSNLF